MSEKARPRRRYLVGYGVLIDLGEVPSMEKSDSNVEHSSPSSGTSYLNTLGKIRRASSPSSE